MPKAVFVQEGNLLDHTPAAAVAAGDVVVLDDLIGIAKTPIEANKAGALALTGVFDVVKDDDASTGTVFAADQPVYWNTAAQQASPTAGVLMGVALAAAAKTDATVRVRLSQNALPPALVNKVLESVTLASASKTLDAQDVGKVMNVTVGHATNVITLPATAAGLQYVIRCGTSGQRVAVSPAAADKIMGADLAGVDDKDRILAAADAVAGDYLHLVADAVNGWFVVAERGKWTAES
jgi:predicted RecA/RadA family phage recombinase